MRCTIPSSASASTMWIRQRRMLRTARHLLFAADGALLDHKAVCAGYGRAYEMLCKAAGIQVIYVASEEMNHGWNAVRLGGTTYYIDCTFDDPIPDRGEYVSDQYFMLTGDELAQTHTWNEAFYEAASGQSGAGRKIAENRFETFSKFFEKKVLTFARLWTILNKSSASGR